VGSSERADERRAQAIAVRLMDRRAGPCPGTSLIEGIASVVR
jgi:hypothetical protein